MLGIEIRKKQIQLSIYLNNGRLASSPCTIKYRSNCTSLSLTRRTVKILLTRLRLVFCAVVKSL